MPVISMTLTETDQSVTRPIIYDIINQVQEITRFNKDTKIRYPGDIARMQTPGSEINGADNRSAVFNTNSYNFIEVEEDYDKEALSTTVTNRSEHIPVFLEEQLQTSITPIYVTSLVTIGFKYRCPSKSEAKRWRDDMRMRISQMRDVNLHSITYHYPLPTEVLDVLTAIHTRRETYLGYNQTFDEWVISNASDRLTLVTDDVGQYSQVAIAETQGRILGLFDFDAVPDKPERDDSTGTWTISFSYKFNYEKPIAVSLRYPIMVHNQLMPEKYTIFDKGVTKLEKINKSFSRSFNAFNGFESDTIMDARKDIDSVIKIPEFDDFRIKSAPTGTGTVFTALSEVDQTDKQTLFNLRELGDITLKRSVLNFIRDVEWPYIGKIYKSLINVSLYRNEFLAGNESLVCDKQLNISAKNPLDLRKENRVRFGLVTDLTLVDKAAIERLRKYVDPDDPDGLYPTALMEILTAINDLFKNLDSDYIRRPLSELELSTIINYAIDPNQFPGYQYGPSPSNLGYNWTEGDQGKLFPGLDTRTIEWYRRNQMSRKTVMITGILTFMTPDIGVS